MLSKLEQILFFLTILFLPTQLGRHFWPPFSFVYSLPVDYLSPVIYFWDLLVISLVAIFIWQKKFISKIALNLLLVFVISQGLSLLPLARVSPGLNVGVGLVRLEQYLIGGLFGVYLASQSFSVLKKQLVWPLTLCLLLETALSVAQFISQRSIGLWVLGERSFNLATPAIAKFDFYGQQFLRPYATFSHPNVLAAFLVLGILLLSLELKLSTPFSKSGLITVLSSAAIFLTVSRTALIGWLVSLVFLLEKRWWLLILGIVLITSPFIYTRYQALLNFDSLSLDRRTQLNEVAINLFSSSTVFGVGLNNFIPAASDKLLVGPSRFLQPAHNIFLLEMSETGLMGLLGLMTLMGYPIYRLLKLCADSHYPTTLIFIWMIIFFLGIFDHYFLTLPQGYRLVFLVWGLSLSAAGTNG